MRLRSLRGKLILRTVPLVLLPALALGAALYAGLDLLHDSTVEAERAAEQSLGTDLVGASLQGEAGHVADAIGVYFSERVRDLRALTQTPTVQDAARRAAVEARELGLTDAATAVAEQRAPVGNALITSGPVTALMAAQLDGVLGEVLFTETGGFTVAASNTVADFAHRDKEWWIGAWQQGTHFGDLEFNATAGIYAVDIAVRVDDIVTGEPLGVLKASVAASVLLDLADKEAADSPDQITIVLADGRLAAETGTGHAPSHILSSGYTVAQTANPRLVQIAGSGGGSGNLIDDEAVAGYATVLPLDPVLSSLEAMTVVVERPRDVAFAALNPLADIERAVEGTRGDLTVALIMTLIATVIAAILGAIYVGRSVSNPVARLRDAAIDSATVRLPETVARIEEMQPGDDPPTIDPIELNTGDELDELAGAFNSLQSTATGLAVREALAKRQRAELFLNLGRRNQNLVSKQLEHLEEMEGEESNPETLAGLLRLDHLATRMRRNAESLLVLAGLDSPRRWDRPVSLRDLMRGAAAETKDYSRMKIREMDVAHVKGEYVGDLMHMLAELIENAARFSPGDSPIDVFGRLRSTHYVVSIVDHGLGTDAPKLEDLNHRLDHPEELSSASGTYLGLFVVGQLAGRMGARVQLVESPIEGLTAKVELPIKLLANPTEGPGGAELFPFEDEIEGGAEAFSFEDEMDSDDRPHALPVTPGPALPSMAAAAAQGASLVDGATTNGLARRGRTAAVVDAVATPSVAPAAVDGDLVATPSVAPAAVDGDLVATPSLVPAEVDGDLGATPSLAPAAPVSSGGEGADGTAAAAAQQVRSRFGSFQAGLQSGRQQLQAHADHDHTDETRSTTDE